jgi:hypothetical protein
MIGQIGVRLDPDQRRQTAACLQGPKNESAVEEYQVVLHAEQHHSMVMKYRAASVEAVLRRAAALLPPGRTLEIRVGDRCVYQGRPHPQPASS